MTLYNVIISENAKDQLENYIGYIQNVLKNGQAAENVWKDAVETAKVLSQAANSLEYCSDPELKSLGYRIIRMRRHRYVMLYRVADTKVYVDAVYHQLQDYESIFSSQKDKN